MHRKPKSILQDLNAIIKHLLKTFIKGTIWHIYVNSLSRTEEQ